MTKFIEWLKSVFGKIGVIWSTLKSSSAGSTVIKALSNETYQSWAMQLVTALSAQDTTSAEKEEAFNKAFNAYCDEAGLTVTKSIVNCLRELALAAYNAKHESAA